MTTFRRCPQCGGWFGPRAQWVRDGAEHCPRSRCVDGTAPVSASPAPVEPPP